MTRSKGQFTQEQGFDATGDAWLYSALMFQPRAVGGLLMISALLQSAWLFATVAALLWWSALVPAHNPFDAVYNSLIARRAGVTRLASGTAPRRFAGAMAGTLALAIAAALGLGATAATRVLEAIFAVALTAVLVARFCAGAWLYRLVTQASSARHGAHPAGDAKGALRV